jgi:hypothetical protein
MIFWSKLLQHLSPFLAGIPHGTHSPTANPGREDALAGLLSTRTYRYRNPLGRGALSSNRFLPEPSRGMAVGFPISVRCSAERAIGRNQARILRARIVGRDPLPE